nr:hypothetical protein [Parachlamydiaceae bacterium]
MNNEIRPLFFGIEANSPWPTSLPPGRLIQEQERHATLAFLGETDSNKLAPHLDAFPAPLFKAGLAGVFDKCLFLPKKHPHVVSWHVDFGETLNSLEIYQKSLSKWLNSIGFPVANHEDNRGRNGFHHPSLRTARAVLAHTALRSIVSSSRLIRRIKSLV